MSFQQILLPIDGSETSEIASDLAMDMARTHDATLHLLYDVEIIPTSWNPETVRKVMKEYREEGQQLIDQLKDRAEEKGIAVESNVLEEIEPHEAIIDYTRDHDIDLIVMGTHGRSGLNRFLLGSTTERVLRTSRVPVLAVPAKEE